MPSRISEKSSGKLAGALFICHFLSHALLTHEAGPGHSRIFDIDEQVLPNAVKIFCGVVYDIMH